LDTGWFIGKVNIEQAFIPIEETASKESQK